MKVSEIAIESTPRLLREAERWREGGALPSRIETPGPGQTSVWDFPRPPRVERVHERLTIEWADRIIVDTRCALRVCETAAPPTYYVAREDLPQDCLVEAGGRTECEWKGRAQYYSVVIDGLEARSAVWIYDPPQPEYSVLHDYFGVYASRLGRCTVAGHQVRPQPGSFYAGWITPDLVGPFKGDPGSDRW